jgi:hypothetical protein
LSNGNKFFGNSVVNVAAEPSFFGSPLTKKPPGRSRAFGLQLLSQPSMADTQSVQMSADKPSAIAGLRDCYDTQINSEPVLNINPRSRSDFNRSQQIPIPIAIDQIALATRKPQKFKLLSRANKPDLPTPSGGPATDGVGGEIPRKDPQIVGGGATSAEHALAFTAQFVGIGNFRNYANDSLGRERRKLTAKLSIKKPLERKLVKFASLPGKLTQPISGSIKGFTRFQQNARIFGRRLQLDLDYQFHGYSFIRIPIAELKPLTLDRTAKAVDFFPFL